MTPSRWAARTTGSSATSTTRTRRRPVVGRSSEVGATGRRPRKPISRRPLSVVRSVLPREATAARRRRDASRTTSRRVGGGEGTHSGSGTPSAKAASTARPPIPSATTWCRTITTAKPPPGSPSNRCIAHSGRSLGRRRHTTSAARSSNPSRPPSSWTAVCRAGSNAESSTHTGGPDSAPKRTSRCRNRGTVQSRWVRVVSICRPLLPEPKTSTAPMFMGTCPWSVARIVRSLEPTRSKAMVHSVPRPRGLNTPLG